MPTFEHICQGTECGFYIVWDFGHQDCYSCTKIGESYNVTEYPEDCPHIEKMKEHEKEES